eukprot:768209_1
MDESLDGLDSATNVTATPTDRLSFTQPIGPINNSSPPIIHTHPYISGTPISQHDNVNVNINININRQKDNNNNGNFTQSALPPITHLPPKLHYELSEETEQDDDAPKERLFDAIRFNFLLYSYSIAWNHMVDH